MVAVVCDGTENIDLCSWLAIDIHTSEAINFVSRPLGALYFAIVRKRCSIH